MSIIYTDYINGDDSTGDGSAGNPYKTITQGSAGLTGGDEVRVAKSPADTALTGTLGFTAGSTDVTGSGTTFTTELAIGDFVKGGDGQYYEIVTITDNTNAVLFKVYPGTTGAGVTGYKLGITSTGEAATTTVYVQTVSVSGSSVASRLKISGGWDLTGPTQDGQTYFRQMHSTFTNRYGCGLYCNYKNFLEIERLHFLRYYAGIKFSTTNSLITSVMCCSNYNRAIQIYGKNNIISSPICNSNATNGVGISFDGSSSDNIVSSPICNSNSYAGIYMYPAFNNTIISPICNYNGNSGISLQFGVNNTIISPICNYNTSHGIYGKQSNINNILKYSGTGNGSGDIYCPPGNNYSENPSMRCQHFNTSGDNRCYYEYGVTYRDTVNARSTQCLKYAPTSATYYISQSFFFKADSGVEQTLSAYIKDDVDFNGDVQVAIYFMEEKITGWTEWTTTTDYVQKSIVASAGDITEDGVLELRVKVRGSAGNVFVDDLSAV